MDQGTGVSPPAERAPGNLYKMYTRGDLSWKQAVEYAAGLAHKTASMLTLALPDFDLYTPVHARSADLAFDDTSPDIASTQVDTILLLQFNLLETESDQTPTGNLTARAIELRKFCP